jgi:hypothetical protein
MQRLVFLIRLSALVVLLLLTGHSGSVAAQGTVTWSAPVNLSNSPTGSVHPAIVADAYGNVHVLWSEEMNGEPVGQDEELEGAANTIMYRRWDGTSWSEPVDVLVVPGEDIAEDVAVAVDPSGRIHATWTGQSNIYYSSAPVSEAGNVHAWTEPIAIADNSARSTNESSIAATASGSIHVIYATRGVSTGVYHVALGEDGLPRDTAVLISAPLTPLEAGYANVRLISDGAGRLHATWQSFQKKGYGQGIYYGRSLDDGMSWSTPVLFRYRGSEDTWVEWPYLTSGENDDLFLTYVDGVNRGRAFRVSRDGGATWSEPKTIVEELEGINGYVTTVVDASGQVHLIGPMRTHEGQVLGIYYSPLLGDNFPPTVPVVVDGHSATSGAIHYMAAAVRSGNEIHLVWNEIRGSEIWTMKGTIKGLTPIPVQATPTAPAPVAAAAPTTDPPATAANEPTPTTGDAPNKLPAELAAMPAQTTAVWTPLLAAAIPVSLLLVGVLIWHTRKK